MNPKTSTCVKALGKTTGICELPIELSFSWSSSYTKCGNIGMETLEIIWCWWCTCSLLLVFIAIAILHSSSTCQWFTFELSAATFWGVKNCRRSSHPTKRTQFPKNHFPLEGESYGPRFGRLCNRHYKHTCVSTVKLTVREAQKSLNFSFHILYLRNIKNDIQSYTSRPSL